MSWISRFIAPIGSAAALLCALAASRPALADSPLVAAYGQQTIRFTHVSSDRGSLAVGVQDPGFADLLRVTGSTLTWKPGERYVLVTTGAPVVVSFSVGDRRYDVGPISSQARFAPYLQGAEVYLPFDELLRSLGLALRTDQMGAVLQPQLTSLDVQAQPGRVAIVARGGAALRPRIVSDSSSAVVYEFDGVGTTLAGTRPVGAGGVRSVSIAQSGTARDPKTTVTVALLAGAMHDAPRSNDDRDVVLGFSGSGAAAALPPPSEPAATTAALQAPPTDSPPNGPAMPAPGGPGMSAPAATPAGPALVTGVSVQSTTEGSTVSIVVNGNATYEWHRLRDPDNRFWIDIKGAQLAGPALEENEPDPLISVRVRQDDPQTVRVAISLAGPKELDVSPSSTGVAVTVGRDEVADAPRMGTGTVGTVVSVNEAAAPVTPAPLGEAGAGPDASWKFGPHSTYVPTNPRLIVIDPGHGGSDTGAQHDGVTEASLALDMAKRLRDLLVARGWQVQMTRDTDVDVYAPNDTAHEELQARVDVANNAGARLFVSIHVNSFINSGPYGTTVYVSKPSDAAFASYLRRNLAANLGTKDDGIVKSHLYVTLHTLMPAALVETAFLSNPNDFSLLTSPAWRQRVAQSIADGIDQYTQAYPVSGNANQ